jgi:hypothetical protein
MAFHWSGMDGAAGRRARMAAAAARARETGPEPATSGVTGRLFPAQTMTGHTPPAPNDPK